MRIDKSEAELRELVEAWSDEYFNGEIYGFGLSDEMGLATFFDADMGDFSPEETDENLHESGFRADTHRTGRRVGRGFRVKAVFDNNPKIQNTTRRGYKILSPEQIPEMGKIKTAIFPRHYYPIKKQLEGYGLKEYEDFIYYNFFVALYNYFKQNKLLLWKATVAVTTRCTLNCKACNMFMPHYKSPADISVKTLCQDLDKLFGRVDFVQSFTILGGEPLLNDDLPEYLEYIKKYQKRISEIVIATNGSIVPPDDLLACAKELGNVRVEINNYNVDAQYAENYNLAASKLKSSGVSYTLREYGWSQFQRAAAICDESEIKRHHIRCNQAFPAFQDSRYYICHLPWSAAQCGLGIDDPADYLDFDNPAVTDFDIVKAGLGHSSRGYTSNCAKCNGCDPELYERIPKAEQL